MAEVGIVMTLNDKLSSALKTIAGNVKAFDKDLDELDATFKGLAEAQEGLITKQTGLKKALETSAVKVADARKEYRKLKDETSKGALDAAIEEQAHLQNELKSTEKAISLNNKAYEALEKSAIEAAKGIREAEARSKSAAQGMKEDARSIEGSMGGKDGALGSLAKGILSSGLLKEAGAALSGYAGMLLTSAIGEPTAQLASQTIGGAMSGAAAGAFMGAPGMAIGAVIGGASGALSGVTAIEQAKDDSFKSYVQENVEGQLAEMDSIRASGSVTAGQREQDQLAFARRFGTEEAARAYLDQVKAMAVNTNYSYDEITGYSKSLLNTYSAGETLEVLQKLSDATAGLNLDSGGVSMFINGLSRMRTTGKVTQEYLNYFSERGLDVYDALARSTGADKSEIAGMVSKGDISGTDAAQAILDYIQEEFGGLSEELAGTYDAMVDNLGDAEANLNAIMGEGYNEARKAGIQAQTDWMESGQMDEAYRMIGQWQASLENTKERLEREALGSVMSGAISGDYADSDQRQRLEELADEYQATLAEYEAGSQEAGAKMGSLLAEARVIAMNEYNASEGAQLALESEKTLIQRVREDTALNDAYWDAGYTLGQEFSKGRAAGMSDGNPITAIFTSGPDYDPDYDPAREFLGYAYGLDRVPYDDYPALLHEGERVLTARQAREQDRGGTAPVINVSVTGNTFGAGLDETAVAQALADQIALQLQAGGGR